MDALTKKKRVALVVAHLGPGGAQRVVATAANALADRGIDVHVVTILEGPPDAYNLDARVKRHRRGLVQSSTIPNRAVEKLSHTSSLPFMHPKEKGGDPRGVVQLINFLKRPLAVVKFGMGLHQRARWLRQIIRQIAPDAVLSFLTQTNILTILATWDMGLRIVVSERNDPRLQKHRRRVVLMRKFFYPWAGVVTANSHGAVTELSKFVPKHKLAFLPNPLRPSLNAAPITFAGPTFVTVTRLVEQKGVDVLIKATAQAFETLAGWRLAIVGDGPLRGELQELAKKLGISARIDWFGHVSDPSPHLAASRFFVLTSRFEGSPNALLEAMACGLPAIVSDASPGPLELIGDEEAGLIVPVEDVDATSLALVRLATDAALQAKLGKAAQDRTRVHHLPNAMQVWLKVLDCN